eukprot:GEMP01007352.1.p1 GENE.GEMP01007352.1~~GEMP01007352.1.p1  ORF type:complete len:497 (+),score=103.35 GEMP01007352.1:98-1588(+)
MVQQQEESRSASARRSPRPRDPAASQPLATVPFVRQTEQLTELKCPICVSVYDKPVSLTCSHHVCQDHVANLVENKLLSCPVCRISTQVPTEGLPINNFLNRVCMVWKGQLKADFRSSAAVEDELDAENVVPATRSFSTSGGHHQHCGLCAKAQATHYCSDCRAELCQQCLKTRHSDGFFVNHAVRSFDGTMDFIADEVFCDEHKDEKLNLYCTDCNSAVCAHCLLTGSHKDHKRMSLSEAYDKGLLELTKGQEKVKSLKSQLDEFLGRLRTLDKEIEENEQAQRSIIEKEIGHLQAVLEAKRVQLLHQSELEMKKKKMQNVDQIEKVHKDRDNVQKLETRIDKLSKLKSQHTLLALNRSLQKDMMNETQLQRIFTPAATSAYRTLVTEGAQSAVGEIELGVKERKPVMKATSKQEFEAHQVERCGTKNGNAIVWAQRPATGVAYVSQSTQMFGNSALQTKMASPPSQFLPTQPTMPQMVGHERASTRLAPKMSDA